MARIKANPDEPKPTKATKRAQLKAIADLEGGINVEAFNKLAKVWFEQEDVLLSFQGEYMNRCKGPHGIQSRALEEAKGAGLPMRSVKAKLKLMTLDRKKEKIRRDLEPVDLQLLNQLEKARKELGAFADTEIGKAHLEALQKETAAAVDALAGEDRVSENIARLTGPDGIKPLEESAQ